MNWRLDYSDKARYQLRKLDPYQRVIILSWMHRHIDGCENPRVHGKGLTANRSGVWRYRVGDYRILCDIQDANVVVLALSVEHRSEVY